MLRYYMEHKSYEDLKVTLEFKNEMMKIKKIG